MKNFLLLNNMNNFERICSLIDLKENTGKRFIVDEKEIAVFKINNEVFALSNICPHQHTALIYDGFIEDGCVVCPAHGWMFDLKTGKTPMGSKGLDSYEVRIIDNEVFVRVYEKEWNW